MKEIGSKINLYVDGTNLLAGLVELFGYENIPSFSSVMAEVKKYFKIDNIYLYASYTPAKNVRDEKIKKQIGLEIKFFKEARKIKNLKFYQGYRSPSSKKEKGVDVHLAVDIVKDAFLGNFKRAVIFSGDADLAYCVEIARKMGLPIFAFFLPSRFSVAIAYVALSPRVLDYKSAFSKYRFKKNIKKLEIVAIKDPVQKGRGRLSR